MEICRRNNGTFNGVNNAAYYLEPLGQSVAINFEHNGKRYRKIVNYGPTENFDSYTTLNNIDFEYDAERNEVVCSSTGCLALANDRVRLAYYPGPNSDPLIYYYRDPTKNI